MTTRPLHTEGSAYRAKGTNAVLALALLALALRAGLGTLAYTSFIDDAYIYLRYAENFAAGHGLTYNPPTTVLGFTSYSFMLVATLSIKLLSVLEGSLVLTLLNLVIASAFLWLLAELHRPWDGPGIALFVLGAFYFPYVDAHVNGMETTLFMAVILGVLLALERGRNATGLILATIAALTRPEGALLFGIVAIYTLRRMPRKNYLAAGALCLCLLAVFLVPLYLYFGSIVPQPMLAKSGQMTGESFDGIRTTVFRKALLLSGALSDMQLGSTSFLVQAVASALLLPAFGLFLVGIIKVGRRSPAIFVSGLFFLCAVAFYHIGQPVRIFSWYTAPTSICFALVAGAGLRHFLRKSEGQQQRLWAPALALVLCGLSVGYGLPLRLQRIDGHIGQLGKVAEQLKQDYPSAKSILISDIGIVGYETGWEVIDLAGLVSPEVLTVGSDGRRLTLQAIFEQKKPDIICLKNDPRRASSISESFIFRRTFSGAQERLRFDQAYRRYNRRIGSFVIFIRRGL